MTTLMNPQDGGGQLIIRGKVATDAYLLDDLIDAKVSLTMDQVSQITLKFQDPDLRLLRSAVIDLDARVDFSDFDMLVASIGTEETDPANEVTRIDARPATVRRLKNRRGKKVMKKVSPSQFVIRECKAAKLRYVVQSSGRRKSVSRDVKKGGQQFLSEDAPSSWSTFQRLAGELKFVCFESEGVVYFGRPSWLLRRTMNSPVIVNYKAGGESFRVDRIPACNATKDGSGANTVTVQMPLSRWRECKVGRALKLYGMGRRFDGYYLIRSVNYDLLGKEPWIEVEASTAIDEGKVFSQPSQRLPAKRASSIATTAQRQAGKGYKPGVEVVQKKPKAGQTTSTAYFDNTELIEWACERNGVSMPDGYANMLRYCLVTKKQGVSVSTALKKRGYLLFDHVNQQVAITLGSGKIVEVTGNQYGVRTYTTTTKRWRYASRIPGARY